MKLISCTSLFILSLLASQVYAYDDFGYDEYGYEEESDYDDLGADTPRKSRRRRGSTADLCFEAYPDDFQMQDICTSHTSQRAKSGDDCVDCFWQKAGKGALNFGKALLSPFGAQVRLQVGASPLMGYPYGGYGAIYAGGYGSCPGQYDYAYPESSYCNGSSMGVYPGYQGQIGHMYGGSSNPWYAAGYTQGFLDAMSGQYAHAASLGLGQNFYGAHHLGLIPGGGLQIAPFQMGGCSVFCGAGAYPGLGLGLNAGVGAGLIPGINPMGSFFQGTGGFNPFGGFAGAGGLPGLGFGVGVGGGLPGLGLGQGALPGLGFNGGGFGGGLPNLGGFGVQGFPTIGGFGGNPFGGGIGGALIGNGFNNGLGGFNNGFGGFQNGFVNGQGLGGGIGFGGQFNNGGVSDAAIAELQRQQQIFQAGVQQNSTLATRVQGTAFDDQRARQGLVRQTQSSLGNVSQFFSASGGSNTGSAHLSVGNLGVNFAP